MNIFKLCQTCSGTVLRRCIQTSSTRHVELTSVRYPDVKRGNYGSVRDSDLATFERLLPGRVLTDSLDGYNTDWLKTCRGASQVVLRPKSTEEVSAILKYCNEKKLAVVPQGGNTGLVGGSVSVFDEIVISTQLMNNIISLDEISGTLVCQAGCVLASLEDYLSNHKLTIPVDLGAKGSCHIGGNVATNAGGVRLLRYGSLHGNVLGLEAVLANGEVVDCLSTLRKDNTGYDLKQLFIGSEGTLGIITAVSLNCPQKPEAVSVAFLGISSILNIWSMRERIAEGLMHDGYCYKYDVSLPLQSFYGLVEAMRERMGTMVTRVIGYGHVGDGNLHLNLTSPEYSTEVMDKIEPFLYDWVANHKGSISAEHGLGFKKKNFIYHSKSKSAVRLMKDIKHTFDPNMILNPYKVLPDF
uniref:D-2-hydroxyglutarate dehydrogenase, mitochondrial n=1 Tax=Magallana gigas TaxID=29159 RepID=K1QDC6_MAGGI